jgi:hypothetical protein
MDAPHFDVQTLAALMSPPSPGYLTLVENLRPGPGMAGRPQVTGEATRHLQQFAERVRDLDDEELRELYEISFAPNDAHALKEAADAIRLGGCNACSVALPVLQVLLAPLEAARNPFAALFKGLCCVMLACRARSARASGDVTHYSCPLESS